MDGRSIQHSRLVLNMLLSLKVYKLTLLLTHSSHMFFSFYNSNKISIILRLFFSVVFSDDLNVSPDFYEYFLGTHELLKNDSTLWCVSAWNDNGKSNNIDVSSPELLYRTDFFPGLGWMLKRELWNELSVKWPKA